MVTLTVMRTARGKRFRAVGTVIAVLLGSQFGHQAWCAGPVSSVAPLTWEQFESRRNNEQAASSRVLPSAASDIDLDYGALTVVADPHGGHFDYERVEALRRLPRYPRRPDEVAAALEEAYGPGSLLTRSAKSLAKASEAAEQTAEPTLNSASAFTNSVLKNTGRAFGVEDLPEFRFKSRANTQHFGIRLEARW